MTSGQASIFLDNGPIKIEWKSDRNYTESIHKLYRK